MSPAKKQGEGIIIVLDVGPTVRASTETTFYSQAKTCLINILQRKIFADKCQDMVGILLFGTDGTENHLAINDQYQHITVLQRPKLVDWNMIELAKNLPRGNSQGDWLDALVIAMDLLHNQEGINFEKKKIVLMTDFGSEFTDDNADSIINGLKEEEIELSVIGPSSDENEDTPNGANFPSSNGFSSTSEDTSGKKLPSLNWNGKCKTPCQLAAEFLIRRIISEIDGIICSFEEAIPQLIFFEKKSQGSANWKVIMDIGPNLRIPVVGKIKIKRTTLPSWKNAYLEDDTAAILGETSFHKKNENQDTVEEEKVISGYRYGTTLVPFGEEDLKFKYSCKEPGAVLSVLGFTKTCYIPLSLRSGDQVLIITARDGDEDGAIAISALIQALKELDMVAVTRRVYRKNLNPNLGVLFPDITTQYECLIWVGLPFQEDVRSFSFPSLNKWISKTTDEQRSLIDQLITDMDLSATEDEEQSLDPAFVVNPRFQYYFNCFTHRALYPANPLPAPEQHILNLLSPPEHQRRARDLLIDKMKEIFPTKKIENYKKKKTDLFEQFKTTETHGSSGDGNVPLTTGDLVRVRVVKISSATPVQDFLGMLSGDQPNYPEACNQMTEILLQMTESLSEDLSSDRILIEKLTNGIKTFREEAAIIDPAPFNVFMQRFKEVVMGRSFSQLWIHITQEKLGLITRSESQKSSVSPDEAEVFMKIEKEQNQTPVAADNDKEDYDNMLDDL